MGCPGVKINTAAVSVRGLLTKLFSIGKFSGAKDSAKSLIVIICSFIILLRD